MYMPWGDGTGPLGLGPMTGRGAGYCAGFSVPGFLNPYPGRGFFGRWFWGRGRGFRWRFLYPFRWMPFYHPMIYPYRYPPYSPLYSQMSTKEEEKAYLEELIRGLEDEIKSLKERLQELSK